MLKHFFFPTKQNNYTSWLTNKKALSLYALVLFIFNLFFSNSTTLIAAAEIDYSQLYEMHNQERAKENLQPLTVNTDLIKSATAKAKAMLDSNCWAHYCPPGTSPWTFFDDAGYSYVYAGENLAEGFSNSESIMTAWMNSITHRNNIMNNKFDEIGIGIVHGDYQNIKNNTIIVTHFGSRKVNSLPETGDNIAVKSTNTKEIIKIVTPKNQEIINNNQPEIIGVAPDQSQIEIFDQQQIISPKINTAGINFVYRPPMALSEGKHQFIAKAYQAQTFLGSSDQIDITIDTIAPQIALESIQVQSLNYSSTRETVIINADTTSPAKFIIFNINPLASKQLTELSWEFEIKTSDLESDQPLVMTAYDDAGNHTTNQIDNNALNSMITQIQQSTPVPRSYIALSFLQNFLTNLSYRNLKSQINLIFIGFIIIVFALDYFFLKKTGMTGLTKAKPHLHLSMFIIIFVILIIYNFSGNILTGISAL
ncbi:MAG: CAP domain-containing protein [bacterium]